MTNKKIYYKFVKQFKLKHKMQTIKTEIKVITPAYAREILNNSRRTNRRLNKENVLRYTKEIQDNKWVLNGESIKLDTNGDLLDGQHRLHAIINANIPIVTMFTTGVEPEAFTTLDTGKKRDGGDVLSSIGVLNSGHVATMIKLVTQLERGNYGDYGTTNRILSNNDFPKIYLADPDGYQESVKFGKRMYEEFNKTISSTLIGGFDYYITKYYGLHASRDFLEKLCIGLNLSQNSPVLALRNRLLANKTDSKKEKLLQSDVIKYIIVGFNKYYENKELKRHIRLPEGEIKFIQPKLNMYKTTKYFSV